MFGLQIPRIAYVLAALVALIAVVVWLRWDAVQDDRRQRQLDDANGRIGHITDTRERRNDVEDLTDDDLRDRLLERVHGHNQSSGPF